jgi:hypothetical protein
LFSLQRSEMFIDTSTPPKILAPLGAKFGSRTFAEAGKAIALLRSFGVKREPPGYKHLAPLGRSDEQPAEHAGRFIFNDPWTD